MTFQQVLPLIKKGELPIITREKIETNRLNEYRQRVVTPTEVSSKESVL